MPDYLVIVLAVIPSGFALVMSIQTQRSQRQADAILAAATHAKGEKNGLVAAGAAEVAADLDFRKMLMERVKELVLRVEKLEQEREQLRLDRLKDDREREEERRARQTEHDESQRAHQKDRDEWHVERDELRAQLKGALEEIDTLKKLLAREEFQALLVAKTPEPVPSPETKE